MKFFYINNSLCEGCAECSVACPVDAIETRAGKRYIVHRKCNSCGGCIRTCGHNAVSLESVDGMVERMENADLYLSRIRRLEVELSGVRERLDGAVADLGRVIEASPVAMALCTPAGGVEASNSRFRELCAVESPVSVTDVLPEGVARIVVGSPGSGDEPAVAVTLRGRPFTARGIKLPGGGLLCVLDDLSDPKIASARIAESLRRAVERKMEMVRQIGTILGDEASSTLNDINRALDLIVYGAPGGDPAGPVPQGGEEPPTGSGDADRNP